MPSWLLKAAIQRCLGALPYAHVWNEIFQRCFSGSLVLTEDQFQAGLNNCRIHVESLRRWGYRGRDFSAFDLGTGWHPVVPVGLFLCGASDVWTWDIVRHLDTSRVQHVLGKYVEASHHATLQGDLPGLVPERLNRLRQLYTTSAFTDPVEALERLNIHYRIGDASASGLPTASVDLIVSTAVLEYLSEVQVAAILREFRRLASLRAVMSHWINFRDQYADFDQRITPFNFLRYSDRTWRLLNNPIIPLNRLRINDYRRLIRSNAFRIVHEEVVRGDPAELGRVPLARRFRDYSLADLLALDAWLIASPI